MPGQRAKLVGDYENLVGDYEKLVGDYEIYIYRYLSVANQIAVFVTAAMI